MSMFIERRGFTKVDALAKALVADMIEAGFVKVWPAASSPDAKAYVLTAGLTVDPLSETQPWSIKLMWDKGANGVLAPETTQGGVLDIIVATPTQFSNGLNATYQRYTGASGQQINGVTEDVPGLIGTALYRYTPPNSFDYGYSDRTFIDRTRYKITAGKDETLSYPMSYQLVVSDHGFSLVVWEQGTEQLANRYSWLIVQRPVDNQTGETIVSGKAPVHCLYGLMNNTPNQPWTATGNYNFRRFVVRESDIDVPAPLAPVSTSPPTAASPMMGVDATVNSPDYNAIINAMQQVSITEANKYLLTFPNNLNTARYTYTYEMDMVAYVSADVVAQGTEVPVQVYGEPAARKYLAMGANGPNNTGMRLLLLAEGGGVDPTP